MKKVHPLIIFITFAVIIAAVGYFGTNFVHDLKHNHSKPFFPDFKHATVSVVCNKLNQFAVRVYASGDSFFFVGKNYGNITDGKFGTVAGSTYYVNKFMFAKSGEYNFQYYDSARQVVWDFLESFKIADSIRKGIYASARAADSIEKLSHDYSATCFVNESNFSRNGDILKNISPGDTEFTIGNIDTVQVNTNLTRDDGMFIYGDQPTVRVPVQVPVLLLFSEYWATDARKTYWKDFTVYVAHPDVMRGFKVDTLINGLYVPTYYDEYMRKINTHNILIWQVCPRLTGDRGVQKLSKQIKYKSHGK